MKPFIHKWVTCPACMIILATRIAADQVTSGGFEIGFSGWEAGGNVAIQSAPPYNPTEGSKLASFNSVNSTPNGYLKQGVVTIPGHRYRLEFDVGNLSFNSQHQRMLVIADDNNSIPPPPGARSPYVIDTIDVAGPGGGATAWVAASYEFIPQESAVRLAFYDVSTVTNSVDLVLDHIRLTELPDLPAPPLANGGFESDLDGWSYGGNVGVRSTSPYGPTEGRKLVAFNAGNSTPDGVIGQSIATLPGHRYRLQFDVGNLSYNSQHQMMRVTALAGGYKQFVVFDLIDIAGPGGGATAWLAETYDFTATSSAVLLVFNDISLATHSSDLVLDHVRLTELVSQDLIINGGFEAGLAGWTYSAGANVAVQSTPPYVPTEGTRLAAFNAGNSAPNGTLSQTVPTTPGQNYRLEFDVGNLAYNSLHQRMHVQVSEHVNSIFHAEVLDIIDIPAPITAGGTRWVPVTYVFAPLGDTLTIVFSDVSQFTNSLDLVLDHVRLVPVP